MMTISFPGGVRVQAAMDGQTVITDQPAPMGSDSAMTPFNLFFASLGTCMGFYALRFCQERRIATEGLGLTLEIVRDEHKRVSKVVAELDLPAEFPDKYTDAISRAIGHCAVKRLLEHPPEIELSLRAPVPEVA
jgi:ribosomal protein S12 methylthiotransferase accessory factor